MDLTARDLVDAARRAGDDEFDPFEAFDRAQGAAVRDAYAHFAKQRAQGSVVAGGIAVPGEPTILDLMYGDRPVFSALSYDAADKVLRDGEAFSSSLYAESIGLVWGHTLLEMDEPEHGRYRRLVQQ